MRFLPAAGHKRMPWKNNKGMTTEIAVFPQAAGLDDFLWRVSMADVVENGAFSTFANVDRTLSVLEGEGIDLRVDTKEPVCLTGISDPFSFPADAQTAARLHAGPITDLNVMTRRSAFRHAVHRRGFVGALVLQLHADTTLLLCHRGPIEVKAGSRNLVLGQRDALLLHGSEDLHLVAEQAAVLFTVALDPLR